MKHATILVAGVVLLAFSAAAPARAAELQPGDKPQWQAKSVNGDELSPETLKGKLVIVDMWATWCGPCMAEAGHMVEVNKKYAGQGLQFIGISLDTDKQKMIEVAKEKGFDWPQVCDGKAWDTTLAKAWGVTGIPATFLFSPDGTLLWTGHPAGGLDEAIVKAFKEHPPQLVDAKTLAEATASLDKVEGALASKDFTGAMKLLGKVPAGASKDSKVAARLAVVQKAMEQFAAGMLAEVEPLVQSKQYPQAVAKLRDLSTKLAGTPAGVQARERLAALAVDPEVKKQIDAADKAEKSEAALAVAQKLQSSKQDAVAYARFKEIVAQFQGTPAATTAASAIADYEKDPVFVKKVLGAQNETKAKAALGMAESYRSAGRLEQAKKKYQEVVDQFPGTPQADKAKKAIGEMGTP